MAARRAEDSFAVDTLARNPDLTIGVAKFSQYPHPISPKKTIRQLDERVESDLEAYRSNIDGLAGGAGGMVSAADSFPTLPRKMTARAVFAMETEASSHVGPLPDFHPEMFKTASEDVYGEAATSKFVKEYKRRVRCTAAVMVHARG